MLRAWKLVRQVYKNPKRPDTSTLDPVDAESVAAINSYVPLLQRVMAQGVSTASAAHLRAVVQHMHAFAAAYEISALQEFLDQRLAALNLLSGTVLSLFAPRVPHIPSRVAYKWSHQRLAFCPDTKNVPKLWTR